MRVHRLFTSALPTVNDTSPTVVMGRADEARDGFAGSFLFVQFSGQPVVVTAPFILHIDVRASDDQDWKNLAQYTEADTITVGQGGTKYHMTQSLGARWPQWRARVVSVSSSAIIIDSVDLVE